MFLNPDPMLVARHAFRRAAHVEQEAQTDEIHDEIRPAEAHKRQVQPGGRQRRADHAEMNDRLQADQRGDAHGQQCPAEIACAERNPKPEDHEHDVQQQQRTDADKAEFLADDRSDEVIVRVGEKAKLLRTFGEPDAERAAGAERDERLVLLVADVVAVLP